MKMQKDLSISHGGNVNCISSPFFDQPDGFGYNSLCSSIFPSNLSLLSLTTSGYSTDDDNTITASPIAVDYTQAVEFAPYSPHSRFLVEHQDLIDRHDLCLSQLRETAKQAEAVRQENINLRMANIALNKRLSFLLQASLQNSFASSSDYTTASSTLVDGFRQMNMGEKAASERHPWDEVSDESPTSVIESDRVEKMSGNGVSLPKSISVRSSGYLKTVQACGSSEGRVRAPNRIKTVNGTQRVYVRGTKKEEEAVELEVYNQGMFKTELCNKWQETGACPYGENCQFAHGIEELRPVLRHPRYKTEVCRMVLAGGPCPYGHRCHFRHSLTDQERLMGSLKPSAPKVDR